MASQCLSGRLHIVVLDPILPTRLLHNGRDLGVMGLDNARKQVMSGLMVEGTSEHGPEPAACGIVLCCSHLQLCPEVRGRGKLVKYFLILNSSD